MAVVLQNGRITQTVYGRSVLARMSGSGTRNRLFADLSAEEDLISCIISGTDPIKDLAFYAVQRAVNAVAAGTARPAGIISELLLPAGFEEEALRELVDDIRRACDDQMTAFKGCDVQVTGAVSRPVISVCAYGRKKRSPAASSFSPDSVCDIIMTGRAAQEGTAIIASEKEDDLLKRFYPDIINTAKAMKYRLSAYPASNFLSEREDAAYITGASQGGVLAALWELSYVSGLGIDVDMKKIPVSQESIEICEYYSLNPYELLSGGVLLAACRNGAEIVKELKNNGICAAHIGQLTPGPGKTLRIGDERGCLNRPSPDGMLSFYEKHILGKEQKCR